MYEENHRTEEKISYKLLKQTWKNFRIFLITCNVGDGTFKFAKIMNVLHRQLRQSQVETRRKKNAYWFNERIFFFSELSYWS